MIDFNGWFSGLTNGEPEEESAVDRTLRMLQGAGSSIQQGATDLYNAAAAPVSPALGETVRGAVSSAYDALPAIRQPATDLYESVQAPMAAGPGYGPQPLPEGEQGWLQTAAPVIQRGATGLYAAAQDSTNAVETIKRAGQAGYEAGAEAYNPDDPTLATLQNTVPAMRAANVVQSVLDATTGQIGRGIGRAAGTSTDPLFTAPVIGPVSSEDLAAGAGQVLLDPTNLIGAGEARQAARVATGPAAREAAQAAARAALRTGSGVIEDVGRRAAGVADSLATPSLAPEGEMLLGSGFAPASPAPGAAAAARAQQIRDEGGPKSSVKKWDYLANAGVDTKEDLAETLRTVPMVTAAQAREMLGDRPDYLQPVADFLLTQRQKALSGAMTPRDVAKAYYMTLMSMRSAAQNAPDLEAKLGRGFVTGAGEVIPPNPQLADLDGLVNVNNGKPLGPIFTEANPRHGGREVRPESAGAAWLWTDEGQRALNAIEEGEFIPEAWERGRHARLAFGSDTVGGNGALRPLTAAEVVDGKVNMTNLPQFVEELNQGIARMRAAGRTEDIGPWLTDQAKRLNGIATGKSAFVKQLLGFGDSVTIDAREINYWLSGSGLLNKSDTSRGAQLARATGQWWDSPAVSGALQPRIQQEVLALRDAYPELLEGIAPDDAAHILHHWLWDKAGRSTTRHTDILATQQLASGFGGGRPTVEVLQERVGKLQKLVADAQRDGDQQLADEAMDILTQTTSELVDARNARMALEPRIASDVGRRVNNAAQLGPESADAAMDARYPQEAVRAAPGDFSGPVGVPVDQSRGRMNAGLGAIPASVRGQLGADAYNAAQGGVFGAASESLQAGQEDRETDFGEQARRALIGAGFGVAAGRGIGRRTPTSGGVGSGAAVARASERISPLGRRLMDTYTAVTPARAEASTATAIETTAGSIQQRMDAAAAEGKPLKGPGMTQAPAEFIAAVHDAIVSNLKSTKIVATGIRGEALQAYLRGEGLTSKVDTRDLGKINKITQGQVNVGGKRAGSKYTIGDAAGFAQRESEQFRGATSGTRVPDAETGAIDEEAPRIMYAYVSEGQPLVGPNRPTVWLVWDDDTPRITSAHHPYGLLSDQDIHAGMEEGVRTATQAKDAVAGGRWAPAVLDQQGNLVEAAPGVTMGAQGVKAEPLLKDWETQGLEIGGHGPSGDPRKIMDTNWLVGPEGEDAMRANGLVLGMNKGIQDAIASGRMADPEGVAAALMRGGAPQWKGGWGAVMNPSRSESLVVDPDISHIKAIYITGVPKDLLTPLEGGGRTGSRITEKEFAQKLRADVYAQTGNKDIPIYFNDITKSAPSEAARKAGATMEGWSPTLMPDAQLLEGPPVALSPGRRDIVERYTQETDPATGRNYTNLGSGVVPPGGYPSAKGPDFRKLAEDRVAAAAEQVKRERAERAAARDAAPSRGTHEKRSGGATGRPYTWYEPPDRQLESVIAAQRVRDRARGDYVGARREREKVEKFLARYPDDVEGQRRLESALGQEEEAQSIAQAAEEYEQMVRTGDMQLGSGVQASGPMDPAEAAARAQASAEAAARRAPRYRPELSAEPVLPGMEPPPRARDTGPDVSDTPNRPPNLGDVPPSRLREPTLPGMEPPYVRPNLPDVSDVPNRPPVPGDFPRERQVGIAGMGEELMPEMARPPREGGTIDTTTPPPSAPAVPPGLLQRFPGVQQALDAAEKRKATMQARGLTPPSGWEWAKQFGFGGIFGPATATGQVMGGALEVGLANEKEAMRALTTRGGGRPGAQLAAQARAVPEALSGFLDVVLGRGGAEGAAARSGGSQGTAKLSERTVHPLAHAAARVLERSGEIWAESPDALFRPLFNAQGMQREADTIAHELGLRGKARDAHAAQLMRDAQAARANPDQALVSGEARRIVDAGKAHADELGYKGDPGKAAAWLAKQSARNDMTGFVASFAVPFPSMAGRTTRAAARMTPGVGLLPGVRAGRPLKGFDTLHDQAVGSVALTSMGYYAANGGITGSGPDDPEKRKMMIAEGWQPHSMLIPIPGVGGVYVPNRVFQKFGPILNAVGEAHDTAAYGKSGRTTAEWASDAGKRIVPLVTDQTGLSGLFDLYDLFMGQGGAGSQAPGFLARAATRYTPFGGTARAVAQATDPEGVARKSDSWSGIEKAQYPEGERGFWSGLGSFAQATGQQLAQNIPANPLTPDRGDVPAAQDPLGRPLPNPQQGWGALVPKVTAVRDDPAIRLFLDAGVDIGAARDAITVGDIAGVPLKPDEQRSWNTYRGEVLQKYADKLTANAKFMALPPEQKQETLRTALAEAAEAADGRVMKAMDRAELKRRAIDTARKKAS